MKNKVILLILSVIVILISISSREVNDKALFSVPSNFPKPTYHFESNPLTPEGVELGKTLFYDAIISSDNTVSCGSCHQQSAGFTQHGHAFSHGVNDFLTKRNSMPLQNLAWSKSFGWDGGVHDLDLFAISPITNPVEMNESVANVLEKLRNSKTYPALFKSAFGSEEINTERFLKALAQFMLTMVSANSRYDKYMRMEGVEFSQVELEGLEIFKQKCASCHSGELFTDFSFRNNGLPAKNEDFGRFDVNQTEADKFKFKVPSLRNLTYTAPYMHDGRFETLEQVLEHYAKAVEKTPYLDPQLNQNGTLGINLSADEKQKIIIFLKTLDDEDFIKQPKFSESTLKLIVPKKDIDDEVKRFTLTSPKNVAVFHECLGIYLKMKEALFKKDGNLVAVLAEKLYQSLNKVDRKQMEIASRSYFEKVYENLFFNADHIIEGKGFYEHQVEHFGDLSADFYKLLASFKPNKQTLYYYECSGKKISWISNLSNEENSAFAKQNACPELKKRTILPK